LTRQSIKPKSCQSCAPWISRGKEELRSNTVTDNNGPEVMFACYTRTIYISQRDIVRMKQPAYIYTTVRILSSVIDTRDTVYVVAGENIIDVKIIARRYYRSTSPFTNSIYARTAARCWQLRYFRHCHTLLGENIRPSFHVNCQTFSSFQIAGVSLEVYTQDRTCNHADFTIYIARLSQV